MQPLLVNKWCSVCKTHFQVRTGHHCLCEVYAVKPLIFTAPTVKDITFERFVTQQKDPYVLHCPGFILLPCVVNASLSSVVSAIHGRVISASADQPHGITVQCNGHASEYVRGIWIMSRVCFICIHVLCVFWLPWLLTTLVFLFSRVVVSSGGCHFLQIKGSEEMS